MDQPVRGSVTNLAEGRKIWLIVQPLEFPLLYVQRGGPLLIRPDGGWFGMATFGKAGQKGGGQAYALFLVSATPEASAELSNALAAGGILPKGLPAGATTLAQVEVHRT